MKILHVIPFFSPKYGGSVSSTYQICQKLAERGHEVTVLTTDLGFDKQYADALKKVQVVPIKSLFHLGLYIYSPQIKKWLTKNLATFDIIHMQNFRSYQNAMVVKKAKILGIPSIVQAHGSVLPFFEKHTLKKLFDFVWGNTILQNSQRVVALTEDELSQYRLMGVTNCKITVIPNGIDPDVYAPLPHYGLFKARHQIPENNKLILFLGRIHKIKGVDILVEAFSILKREIDNITLVIIGPDDGYRSELQQQINDLHIGDTVLFTDALYGLDKVSAYVDADVYVLPSVYEAFPITVLESWACGTPVVISDSCALSPTIVKEEAGIVVKRDPNEMGDAISRILSDDGLKVKITTRGRTLVEGDFNINSVIREIEACYLSVLHQGGINPKSLENELLL